MPSSPIAPQGANARCLAANGSTFAPTCIEDISRCYCDRANPNAQRWVQDMEETVLTQGAALKARAAALGKTGTYPVLGYVEGLSLQQWYKAQAALLYNASMAPYLLSVASKGVIDCFRDGCDWQGAWGRRGGAAGRRGGAALPPSRVLGEARSPPVGVRPHGPRSKRVQPCSGPHTCSADRPRARTQPRVHRRCRDAPD